VDSVRITHHAYLRHGKGITNPIRYRAHHSVQCLQLRADVADECFCHEFSPHDKIVLPHPHSSGGCVDGMRGVASLAFALLVQAEKEGEWVKYSIAKQGWIGKSERLKEIHSGHQDPLYDTIQIMKTSLTAASFWRPSLLSRRETGA
jgi:hypothetical protein